MKKIALMILLLVLASGLLGCPRRYYDRDRNDHDRGHDYEHRDRYNDNQDHHRQRGATNEKNKNEKISSMIRI